MPDTFRAVVFHGAHDVRVEDRPFPDLKDWSEKDAIVRVTNAGIITPSSANSYVQDCVAAISMVRTVRGSTESRLPYLK
jgi:hypothetical protein